MKRTILLLFLVCAFGSCVDSCGGRDTPEPPAPPPPAPEPTAALPGSEPEPVPDPPAPVEPAEDILVELRVVDSKEAPLAGMMPIATLAPNAFDNPVAHGTLTDEQGATRFQVPAGETLYVRAWDPELKMFPANFYTLNKGADPDLEPLRIVMAPGAVLEATVLTPEGAPAMSMPVEVMLIHTEWGPWWPTEGVTDLTGKVRFPPIPPGEYEIAFRVVGVGQTRSAAVSFAPGERVRVDGVLLE